MIEFTTSRMDIFKIKKMILVMNERFNLVELKIREIELSSYKDDTSWIVLSKYHILLDCKKEVYKLTKKISNELKKEKVLCYCILHSYPTLEHFINDRLISYPYSKYGYYVNDLYKAYVDLEHLNFDIKSILDKYLDSSFAKQYFKLMVMYTYISGLETIDFKTYEGINRYIWYT